MPHRLHALFAAFCLLCCACQPNNSSSGKNNGTSPQALAGYWIPDAFCASVQRYGSVIQAMNKSAVPLTYAIAFSADAPGTVGLYNGFEAGTVKATYRADTIVLQNVVQGKPVYLYYDAAHNKDLTMLAPGIGNEASSLTRFVRALDPADNAYAAFEKTINQRLFPVPFRYTHDGKTDTITLRPDGSLTGIPDADHYKVCTGGDCFLLGPEIDILTLTSKNNPDAQQPYGFRYSATQDTLTLYELWNEKLEEKGAYKIKGVAYQWVKNKK